MSLTSCLNKAGDLLDAADRRAILERAALLRQAGVSAFDAGLQAIKDRDAQLAEALDALQERLKRARAKERVDAERDEASRLKAKDETSNDEAASNVPSPEPDATSAAPMPPELAARIASIRIPATTESVRSAVSGLIGVDGALPGGLGRVVVANSSEIKRDWQPLIGEVTLESEQAGDAMGFYDPRSKTIFLIADRIQEGQEAAVALHELMHKHGRAVLGEAGWTKLHGAISGWANAAEGSAERRVYEAAAAAVRDSRPDGAGEQSYSTEELFPYAVQSAVEMGIKPDMLKPTGTVERWLGEVRRALRQVWTKVVGTPKADGFSVQNLVVLAYGIAQRENPAHRGELDGAVASETPGQTNPDIRYSRGSDTGADGKEQEATPEGFVAAPDGSLDYGEITQAMSKAMRRQAGKIRLQHGEHLEDGTGYGLAHIEANHGKQIRNAGFESVQGFVAHVAGRFNEILQATQGRQLLVAVSAGRRDVMFVQLEPAPGGDFYRVNTAFPASRDYLEKQEARGAKVLWTGSEPRSAAAGRRPPYAGGPEDASGRATPIAQGESTGSSVPPDGSSELDRDAAGAAGGDQPGVQFSRGGGGRTLKKEHGSSTPAPATSSGASPASEQATRPSDMKKSAWLDATNRVQFAPGAWLNAALGRATGPLWTKLQMRSASPEMKRQLRRMKLDIQKAQETSVAVAREMQALSAAEREMVSDIIERDVAAGFAPPEHAVRMAAVMNQAMGAQSRELVRLGMLSDETAKRWDGAYLPRYYESKLRKQAGDAWADAARRLLGRTRVMPGIRGKHLKGRGLYEIIATEDLAHYQAMGWEVRDTDFDTASGSSPDGQVQVWRDYTRDERSKMGEIRDAGFRFVMGYMQTQRDIAVGRLFEGLANDPAMSSRNAREGWVRVPDGTVEGTGAKRYGQLSGRYVPSEVLSQLSSIDEAQSAAWAMYRKALGIWKMGKTAMNPVSHMNNVLSNLTMAHFAGVSYHRADKYLAAVHDFATNPAMLREARDNGLFLSTMSAEELAKGLPAELRDLAMKAESATLRGVRTTFDLMTFFLRKPLGKAYEFEDLFFRYLIYKDARERGLEPQEAVDYAQRYIFTYDDLPKGARYIRDFGIPFFSYTYKALPALLHTALVYPWRFAAPAAVLWTANAIGYAMAVDDDDSWMEAVEKYLTDEGFRDRALKLEGEERQHLPPWMKGTSALLTPKAIRLGTDEVTSLPLFIDVARIIPGGDTFDVSPNAGGLPLPQPLTPSHPLLTIAMGLIGNKDTFTGREIASNVDTSGEAAQKRAEWLWRQIAPASAIGSYHWERSMNALAQATGEEARWTAALPNDVEDKIPESIAKIYTGTGRDGLPVQPKYAAMQTFGLKVRPIDLEMSAAIDRSMREKMVRDIDAELRRMVRLHNKGAISKQTFEGARKSGIEKIQRLGAGLTVDGDEKD